MGLVAWFIFCLKTAVFSKIYQKMAKYLLFDFAPCFLTEIFAFFGFFRDNFYELHVFVLVFLQKIFEFWTKIRTNYSIRSRIKMQI